MEERKILVAKTTEVAPDQMKRFKLGFRNALVVNSGGAFKAYYEFCTHQGGQLKMVNGQFQCLRHFSTFNLNTGERLAGEAPEGSKLGEIPLEIRGEEIFATWIIND